MKVWAGAVRDALRRNALLAAILAVTLGNCLLSAHWGLPDGATVETASPWAVDTIAPLGPLREAHAGFARIDSEPVIYPLFHHVVLCAAYAPYVFYAVLTGSFSNPRSAFPYGAEDPSAFFATLTLIASVVSALMAAGIVLSAYLLARDLFGRSAGLWTAAFTSLVPPLAYYGMTSNLDVPYLFWTMLATWLLIRALTTHRSRDFVLCGACAGLAFATKDQAAGFFIAWPLVVLFAVARHRRTNVPASPSYRTLIDPRVLGAAIAAAAAFALGNNLLLGGWDGFMRHLAFTSEFYDAHLATQNAGFMARQPAVLAQSALLLVQMVGPPVLILAIAGMALSWRERRYAALVLPLSALTCYVAVVAPTSALSRYLLGIVLLLVPFAGHAAARAMAATRSLPRRAGAALAALAVLWQLALVVHLHGTLWNDARYAMERWVRTHVPPGTLIESSTQARYLPRLADDYRYDIVGNTFDAVAYGLRGGELTLDRVHERQPPYILVLADSGLSGDPQRIDEPQLREYYDALLSGRAGYVEAARFSTPSWLPYRQLTAGTQPTAILLARRDLAASAR